MPEGSPKAASLYERDYYAWALDQAEKLRRLAGAEHDGVLDLENLAEEVADLGASQRDAVHSQIRRIIEHLERFNWSQTEAAESLHVPLSTLNQKIKRLDIKIRKKSDSA